MCSNRCMFSDDNVNSYNISESSYNNMNGAGYSSNYNMNYGYTYVPYQGLNTTFLPMQGLANGTIFPELVSPYYPNQSLEVMNYLKYNNGGGCGR